LGTQSELGIFTIEKITTNMKHQISNRHLDWSQCYNTRDLGGLSTRDGKETGWEAVIRSDILSQLTDEGQQALLDYGVKTIIDLRSPQEVAKEPSVIIKNHEYHLDYLNLPLEKYYLHVSALINQAKTRSEVYCIILDHYPDAVVEIMRAIIKAQPGGIVIHCHAGKDRTGIVSALLLSLLDVPTEIISADYAESQERLWPLYEKILAETKDKDKKEMDFWARPTATEEMMSMMLEHIDTQYGGVEKYLLASGLLPNETDQLRRRLLAS
jgi:protein-tyrosine phosphatase